MSNQFTAPWTPEGDAQLRDAYAAATSGPVGLARIAELLGRSTSAIAHRASRLGVTSYGRSRSEDHARVFVEHIRQAWAKNGHPRGMAGKRHTAASRKKMSIGQRALVERGVHGGQRPHNIARRTKQSRAVSEWMKTGGNAYSRCKHGRRSDLNGQYFRSSWEANYARFLNLLIAQGQASKWEYEADTFWFEKIRRGVRSYTPDFKVTEASGRIYYVEVKGWMDAKSATKLRRMAKYHPLVDLRLVDAKAYREIAKKLGGAIPGWESAS